MNRRLLLVICVTVALASLAEAQVECQCLCQDNGDPANQLCNHPKFSHCFDGEPSNDECTCDCTLPAVDRCDEPFCTQGPSSACSNES